MIDDPDPVRRGYARAAEAFDAAAAVTPVVEERLAIAGRAVRLRVAGPELARALLAPWSHLVTADLPSEDASLGIDLWHEAESSVVLPRVEDDVDARGRFPYGVSPDDRVVVHRQPETTVWFDRVGRRIVGCVGAAERRALYEAGRPIEFPLLIWLRDCGVPLVHASFVALDGRGALLVGRSGSGKSTLAARCTAAGFAFLGDDKVALSTGPGVVYGHSLNGSLHVDRGTLDRLPELSRYAVAPVLPLDDKYRVAVDAWRPDALCAAAPVTALILPRISGGRGIVRPVAKREALLAVSLSTLLSLPIAAARSLDPLADLVDRVPAFVVDLNPDVDAAARLASVLDRARTPAPTTDA